MGSFDRNYGQYSNLIKPKVGDYKPWKTYTVRLKNPIFDFMEETPTAKHYYSYWQVHQLFLIQRYPDLYENQVLVKNISKVKQEKLMLPRAFNSDIYKEFEDKKNYYDALSQYITMYHREQRRTFAPIPEVYRTRTLNPTQLQVYHTNLSKHAKFVVATYSLSENGLYKFLCELLDLKREYEKIERFKLVETLKSDISFLANLIKGINGNNWEDIGNKLRKITFWYKQEFHQVDPSTRMRDKARELLLSRFNFLSKQLPSNLRECDIDEIVKFCEENGLSLLLHTL